MWGVIEMIIGFQKIGLNEKDTSYLCQAWGKKIYDPYIKLMVLWVSIVPAVLVFCGSCHCLSKTSVPHLVLFSRKFIMLNQLFPQQPCCFKQELKTSVPIRRVCCNGDVSFMRMCILLRRGGNNFRCVFLF